MNHYYNFTIKFRINKPLWKIIPKSWWLNIVKVYFLPMKFFMRILLDGHLYWAADVSSDDSSIQATSILWRCHLNTISLSKAWKAKKMGKEHKILNHLSLEVIQTVSIHSPLTRTCHMDTLKFKVAGKWNSYLGSCKWDITL